MIKVDPVLQPRLPSLANPELVHRAFGNFGMERTAKKWQEIYEGHLRTIDVLPLSSLQNWYVDCSRENLKKKRTKGGGGGRDEELKRGRGGRKGMSREEVTFKTA